MLLANEKAEACNGQQMHRNQDGMQQSAREATETWDGRMRWCCVGDGQEQNQCQRAAPDGLELDLRVPPDLEYFAGHFPGIPILPGVVQIDWSVRLGRARLPVRGAFVAADEIARLVRQVVPNLHAQNWANNAAQNPALFQATGFSDHPYVLAKPNVPPNKAAVPDPNYAEFSQLPHLASTVDHAMRADGSAKRFPIWNR